MEPLFKLLKIEDPNKLGKFYSNDGNNSQAGNTTFGPAPAIVPYGQSGAHVSGKSGGNRSDITTINVTNTFSWTNAPPLVGGSDQFNPRYDIPSLELREESIQLNPALNNLARNLYIAGDNAEQIQKLLQKASATAGTSAVGQAALEFYLVNKVAGAKAAGVVTLASSVVKEITGKGLLQTTANTGAKLVGQGADLAKKANENKTAKFQDGNPASGFSKYDQYLAPYQDIYATKGTGWRYKVPYLEDQQRANTGAFQNASSLFGGMVNKIRDLTTAISAFHSPGQYIDAAKSYMFGGGEKSYSVSFPLLNTGLPEDILRNWQFLFMLAYQNRPNRIDRLSIAPPKIYEAMIPGVWWCRHAYISNMTVNFTGNRRKMTLMLPVETDTRSKGDELIGAHGYDNNNHPASIDPGVLNNPYIDEDYGVRADKNGDMYGVYTTGELTASNMPVTTIIPDAYEVTITLTELIPESQNTMFAAIQKPNTVTVTSGEGGKEEGRAGSLDNINDFMSGP